VQNHYFVQFLSTNFTMEQNWWHFCRALLHLKDNYVFRIPKFRVLRVPPIQIPTQNGKMKILKFVNLMVSYKFQILNAILNYLVCNMMKVFTRPTSASEFFYQILIHSTEISENKLELNFNDKFGLKNLSCVSKE
jgi:hypothetical protein